METLDTMPVGQTIKNILLLLGSNGNLGSSLLDSCHDLFRKYDHIFCIDKDLNPSAQSFSSSSVHFIVCDAIKDDYLKQLLFQLNTDQIQLDALNLIAQDYPVTTTGLSDIYTSPFSIDVSEYVQSLSVTAASSYHLIKQVIDLQLLSSSIWLVGSIYDRVLPSPSLYSSDSSLYKPIAYSSGKYAQIPLRNQASVYLAKYGGRCNSLSFGGIELNQSPEFVARYCTKAPSKSLVPMSDVLKMIKWALLESPKSLNGSDILIDGAFSLS